MSDERLLRILAKSAAPLRDRAFTLKVLERAERLRFQRARLRAILHGGGVAGAAAAGLLVLALWANAHPASASDAAVWTAGLLATAWLARLAAARISGAAPQNF